MRSRLVNCLMVALLSVARASGAHASPPDVAEHVPDNRLPSGEMSGTDPLLLADSALQGRRLFEAEAYRAQLAADPRPEALLLRAELALISGNPGEAIALIDRVGADSTFVCRAEAVATTALLQLGQPDLAKIRSDALGSSCWADAFYWRSKGRIAYARSDIDTSVAAFREALVLQPSDRGTENDLAVSLIAAGDAEQASRLLGALLHRSPDATDVSLNLDFANAMRGIEPERRPREDDDMWSLRLQFAGQGARQARRLDLAGALLARALINRPRYDHKLWQQYAEVTGRDD